MLPLPVSVVAFKGINLELLKGSGSFQVKELNLDPFSKTMVKFPVQHNIIPPSVGGVLGEFNQAFVDVVVFLHFEGMEGMLGCLSEVGLPE